MIHTFLRIALRFQRGGLAASAAIALAGACAPADAAPNLPEIRLSARNAVPSCVTPDRLMAFLKKRNGNLSPRFGNIASFYKQHGEAWHVRWDYAFFQMAIETNFLTYRAPSGRMGDVDPKQNNFAGIGTTGGGVPGDSFPDVSTGVLGQIQHLVVYSGEMIPEPVAPRTRLKQEHILAKSRELNRPVRFSDLARRWAADPKYGSSIEWIAERFRTDMCRGRGAPQEAEVLPWQQKAATEAANPAQSAVRTVWAKGQEPQAVAAPQPKPKPQRKAIATASAAPSLNIKKAEAPPKVQAPPPAAKPVVAAAAPAEASVPETQPVQAAAVPSAPEPAANEPEAGFAFFTPPAALASVTMPTKPEARLEVIPRTVAVDPSTVPATVPELPVTPVPDAKPVVTHSVTVPPTASVPPVEKSEPLTAEVAAVLPAPQAAAEGHPSKPAYDPPSGLGMKPSRCMVETATFGGETTVLVKTGSSEDVHYVALSVLDGFEESMTNSFLAARPEGGEALGTFPSKDAALAKARALCPE